MIKKLSVICLLAIVSAMAWAQVNPTADAGTPDTPCINGLWAVGKCPPGYAIADAVIFSENFDDQPDWTTTGRTTIGSLPLNWDGARTDEAWHPSTDAGTQPSMMINGDDPTQVYGGTGKAFISYSESNNPLDDNGFESDNIIEKDIPETNEVYVKFHLKFQPGWATNSELGQIKMLRIGHWDGPDSGTGERFKFGSDGNNAPLYFYDWSQNSYGVRHFHAFRCDQQVGNYFCTTPVIAGAPRQIISGDMSADYGANIAALGAQIPDLVNGGILNYTSLNYHNQVFGAEWHLMEFYLKLNSAPGIQDGVFKHWIDGELVVNMLQMPWIGAAGSINAKFNIVALGGNDRYHFDLVGAPVDRERWYSIDNLVIMSALPVELQ